MMATQRGEDERPVDDAAAALLRRLPEAVARKILREAAICAALHSRRTITRRDVALASRLV